MAATEQPQGFTGRDRCRLESYVALSPAPLCDGCADSFTMPATCITAIQGALCEMQQSGVWMGALWWAAGPWWGTVSGDSLIAPTARTSFLDSITNPSSPRAALPFPRSSRRHWNPSCESRAVKRAGRSVVAAAMEMCTGSCCLCMVAVRSEQIPCCYAFCLWRDGFGGQPLPKLGYGECLAGGSCTWILTHESIVWG